VEAAVDTTHHPSPTGDPRLDKLLPLADRLVQAAHRGDQLGTGTAFADAELLYGDPLTAARALAVLLAGMCPDDSDADDLLSWRLNPTEYHRLRSHGVAAAEARTLAARVAHLNARGSVA
jgi:hypothetical protein